MEHLLHRFDWAQVAEGTSQPCVLRLASTHSTHHQAVALESQNKVGPAVLGDWLEHRIVLGAIVHPSN